MSSELSFSSIAFSSATGEGAGDTLTFSMSGDGFFLLRRRTSRAPHVAQAGAGARKSRLCAGTREVESLGESIAIQALPRMQQNDLSFALCQLRKCSGELITHRRAVGVIWSRELGHRVQREHCSATAVAGQRGTSAVL